MYDALKFAVVIVPAVALGAAIGSGKVIPMPSLSGTSPKFTSDTKATSMFELADEKTKHLRCPPIDEISQNMRKVAKCYATLETNGKEIAEKLLNSVRQNKDFFECVSPNEKKLFFEDLKNYLPPLGVY